MELGQHLIACASCKQGIFFFKGKRKNDLKVVTKTKKTPPAPSGFMACGRWSHAHLGGFQGAECSQGGRRCSLEHRGEGAPGGENDSKRDVGDDSLSSRRPVGIQEGGLCRAWVIFAEPVRLSPTMMHDLINLDLVFAVSCEKVTS